MTVEIVKRGERPEDRKWKATCSNCGTVMHYKEEDVWVEPPVPLDDSSGMLWGGGERVTCPVCGSAVGTHKHEYRCGIPMGSSRERVQ